MSDKILDVEGIVTQQVGSLIWLGQIERSAVAAINDVVWFEVEPCADVVVTL